MAVPRRRRDRGRPRTGAIAYATRGDHRLGIREGFLVVSLTWLARSRARRAPVRPLRRPAARPAGRRLLRGHVRLQHHRAAASSRTSRSCRTASLLWRQFTQWLGGIGIIVLALAVLPRLRVGGRQLLEHEMPGPEIESLSTRIRDTARRVWVLYVALTAVLFAHPARALGDRRRRADVAVRRGRARVDDHPDGRLLDEGRLDRGLRAGDAVGDRRLHDPRRLQLRADVPRARPAPAARARRATRSSGSTSPCSCSGRSCSSSARSGPRTSSPAQSAIRARRVHGRLDDDDDRLLGRRLQHLAAARADDDRRADVRRRLGGLDHRAR